MSEIPPPDPLGGLGDRIDRARQERLREETARRGGPPSSGSLGIGFRIAIELVAALCVGLAIGWVFDRVLGTKPWGLIAFFFLGAAAGMTNVFRAAKNIGAGGAPPSAGGADRTARD
ncbi:MAG: AtpZ/AtpI family protein [Stellaceae bacterium]|jgi:ATP synthase protein I